MNDYVLMTDVCADLSPELAEELGIYVLPMTWHMLRGYQAGRSEEEERSLHPLLAGTQYLYCDEECRKKNNEFYKRLQHGDISCSETLKEEELLERFRQIFREGKDVLYLSVSLFLFESFNRIHEVAEKLKQEFPDRQLLLVDTQMVSAGQAALVYYAALKKKAGADIYTVRDWAEENKNRFKVWYLAGDPEYLGRRGGMSAAAAMDRSRESVVPVWTLGKDDAAGQKRLEGLVQYVKDSRVQPDCFFISQAVCQDASDYICRRLTEECGVKRFYCGEIGPATGGCFGGGTIMLACMGDGQEQSA